MERDKRDNEGAARRRSMLAMGKINKIMFIVQAAARGMDDVVERPRDVSVGR